MKNIFLILSTASAINLNAQNIFPIKLDNCKTEKFCLDCGDVKAGYIEQDFLQLQNELQESLNLKGIRGAIQFQVLVDSKGKACVLSHTDQSKNPFTAKIIEKFNKFKNWSPAITGGKKEEKSSINLVFTINENKIKGNVERVDVKSFTKSFDKPQSPEIFNKIFDYKNENLKNYKITVWNSKNSTLPNNMNDHIAIDKNGLIWLTVDEGLVTFDGKDFKNAEQNITDKGKFFTYYELTSDNDNTKWVSATNNIYSFSKDKWTKYDPKEIGID